MRSVDLTYSGSIALYSLTIILSLICMQRAYKSKERKKQTTWLIMVIFILSIVGFFRFGVGIDYTIYYTVGDRIQRLDNIKSSWSYWGRLEASYGVLSYCFGKVGLPVTCVIGLYSLLTQIFMVEGIWYFKKYSNPVISLFLYTAYFYFRTFNMFRQSLSLAIIFFAIRYVEKKQYGRFVCFVILAAVFHKTALISLIMLVYFGNNKKKSLFFHTLFYYIIPAFVALSFEYLMGFVKYLPIFSAYVTDTDAFITFKNESLVSLGSLLLIIEVILYLSHRRYEKKEEKNGIYSRFFDKVIFCEVLYFILDNKMGNASRIILYFSVPSIIVLSAMCGKQGQLEKEKPERYRITIYQMFVVLYGLMMFVRIMLNNGYGQLPYSFWF